MRHAKKWAALVALEGIVAVVGFAWGLRCSPWVSAAGVGATGVPGDRGYQVAQPAPELEVGGDVERMHDLPRSATVLATEADALIPPESGVLRVLPYPAEAALRARPCRRPRCVPRQPIGERSPEAPRVTPPAQVATQPRTACVEPYDNVQACVDELWINAGLGWELNFMHSVVSCESGWRPWATGGAGEAGLFQIHPVNWHLFNGRNPWDVRANTEVALIMRKASGWGPWSCAR